MNNKDPYGNPLPQNPYSPNGTPNFAVPGMGYPMPNYEQLVQMQYQMRQQQKEYLEKLIREKYPKKYAMVHSGIFVLLGLAAIAVQIVLIVKNAYLSEAGSGIICGVSLFGLAALSFFETKYHNFCLHTCLILFYMLGLIFIPLFMVMINIMAILSSSYACKKTGCDSAALPLQIILMAIAGIMFVMSIAFLIVMQCSLGRQGMQGTGVNQIGMAPSSLSNNMITKAY